MQQENNDLEPVYDDFDLVEVPKVSADAKLDKNLLTELLISRSIENQHAIQDELLREKENSFLEAEAQHALIEDRITFFHDKMGLELHKKSFVLVSAPTGSGKSTFAIQTAVHAIMNKRKVLIVTNEMSRTDYMDGIINRVSVLIGKDRKETHDYIYDFVLIEDSESSGHMTEYWKLVCSYTFKKIEEFKPDIVILDQLSNAMADIETDLLKKGRNLDDYRKLSLMTLEFSRRIINRQSPKYPPILALQQSMPPQTLKPASWDMKDHLRGGKDTLDRATHGIMIVRKRTAENSDLTFIKVGKVRATYDYTWLSVWEMDKASKMLVPSTSPGVE
jgi:KaiC/GvpD/RAD55 family RecA-like ATPase